MPIDYKKHVEKATKLAEEKKRRPLKLGRGLADHAASYTLAAGALEWSSLSKIHAISCAMALVFSKRGESASGLFGDEFVDLMEVFAKKLKAWVLPSAPSGATIEVLRHWILLTVIIHVGLLEWGRLKAYPARKEILFSERFREELILRLFFETKTSELVYDEMGNALKIAPPKMPLFTGSMGLIGLSAALVGLSRENEVDGDFFEALRKPWMEYAERVLKTLPNEEVKGMGSYLEPLYEAADRNDLEGFKALLNTSLQATGMEPASIQSELQEVKKLFMRLVYAWESSKGNKATMIHMVG